MEIKQSYLIQRLLKPYDRPVEILYDNPFAFGGGLANGGLSSDAMDLLRPIFRFDYMGSAEFEFGEVPRALSKIYENRDKYISWEFLVNYKYESWYKKKEVFTGKKLVYVICQKDWVDTVKDAIWFHAKHSYSNTQYYTKEVVFLNRALSECDDEAKEYQGWLELDNGYFFFTNKTMFDKTCQLFGIIGE